MPRLDRAEAGALDARAKMDVASHPHFSTWQECLANAAGLAQPWTGDAFRFGSFEYIWPEDIVSGVGSARVGARWNAAGSPPTLYASLTRATAAAECDAAAAYYGQAHLVRKPLVAVTLRISLQAILDLCAPACGRILGTDLQAALAEDWRAAGASGQESTTQAVGRAARMAGLEGLLVPSAQVPGEINLVCFREGLRSGSRIEVWGDDILKRVSVRYECRKKYRKNS